MPDPITPPTPVRSHYAGDPDMAGLIDQFLQRLPEHVETLERLWREQRFDDLRATARQVGRDSAGFGFAPLGDAADRLQESLWSLSHGMDLGAEPGRAGSDIDRLRAQFQELIDLCRRAGA